MNSASNIYHLAFRDVNDIHNVRFYNGSTHASDYSWTWSGSGTSYFPFGIGGVDQGNGFYTNKFDVNGDGVNEIYLYDQRYIVNPVNGNVLYSTTENISYIIDIDGD